MLSQIFYVLTGFLADCELNINLVAAVLSATIPKQHCSFFLGAVTFSDAF